MRPKYIREKLDGSMVYPIEPTEIKSRQDLTRWFEWTSQFEVFDDYHNLLEKLKLPYTSNISKNTETGCEVTVLSIFFPRCKHITYARFFGKECFSVTVN
jgi:hypothetical protein